MLRPRGYMLPLMALLTAQALASPTAIPQPDGIRPYDPLVTSSATDNTPSRTLKRDILSKIESGISSLTSPPGILTDLPTGGSVKSSLGIDDAQVSALPTQVLNIDPYANWTSQGWQVRFHGNVYKQPNSTKETLNKLANKFLIGTDIESLPADQQDQARNVTAGIFVLQQGDVNVSTIHLEPASSQGSSGQSGGGGATTATGGTQEVTLPYKTTPEGDFDVFVPISSNGLTPGNATKQIQRLNTYVQNATLGNATAYLVPEEGVTIVSDIDDILRITKIYQPKEGILNSFARPFTPWENMPSIYANWSRSLDNVHFHYLTTTPEQITRNYMDFIYSTYPGGSFDTRPLNFSDVSATLSIRKFLLEKVFQTFPRRKFVLVADTSNPDVMKDYPAMATQYPGRVCILLRNTSATDSGDKFPYDTSGFKGLNQTNYMFFVHSDDLTNLDIGSGNCYNRSIPQNLTFGYQGTPLSSQTSVNGSANSTSGASRPGEAANWPQLLFAALLTLSMWFAL